MGQLSTVFELVHQPHLGQPQQLPLRVRVRGGEHVPDAGAAPVTAVLAVSSFSFFIFSSRGLFTMVPAWRAVRSLQLELGFSFEGGGVCLVPRDTLLVLLLTKS